MQKYNEYTKYIGNITFHRGVDRLCVIRCRRSLYITILNMKPRSPTIATIYIYTYINVFFNAGCNCIKYLRALKLWYSEEFAKYS